MNKNPLFTIRYILVTLLVGVAIVSCSSQTTIKDSARAAENLAWPPAPSSPRIKFIEAFANPEDLNITIGVFGLLKELAAGKEDNALVLPMATVVNDLGQIFVADQGAKLIHRYDKKRGKHVKIKIFGDKSFASPVGLAADAEGNVYITDSDLAKIYKITINDDKAEAVHLDGDFLRPTGIAVDHGSGWIYVVDTGLHAVYIFTQEGKLVKRLGGRGTGEGEFNFPTYIGQDKERNILVTDSLNFRVQKFDRFGRYLAQFGKAGNGTGDLARPKGIAEDSAGHIYITDALFHTVQIFDSGGNFLLNFGIQGTAIGEFWLPVGIFIDKNDYIYVSDSYNRRVQVFQYIGEPQ